MVHRSCHCKRSIVTPATPLAGGGNLPISPARPRAAPSAGTKSSSRQDTASAKQTGAQMRLPLGGLCIFAQEIILSVIETYVMHSGLSGNLFQLLRVGSTDSEPGIDCGNPKTVNGLTCPCGLVARGVSPLPPFPYPQPSCGRTSTVLLRHGFTHGMHTDSGPRKMPESGFAENGRVCRAHHFSRPRPKEVPDSVRFLFAQDENVKRNA